MHRGDDVPGAVRAARGRAADGAAGRARGLRLGVGQRPHDDPALRAARVPGAAQLLRAPRHLHVRGRPHHARESLHLHPGAADAPHRRRRQASGDARPALRRATHPGRRHRRLPGGVRGALPRRPRGPARRRRGRGDAGPASPLHRAPGHLPRALCALRGGRVLSQASPAAAPDLRRRQPPRGPAPRRRAGRGVAAGRALPRGDRQGRGGRPPCRGAGRSRRLEDRHRPTVRRLHRPDARGGAPALPHLAARQAPGVAQGHDAPRTDRRPRAA